MPRPPTAAIVAALTLTMLGAMSTAVAAEPTPSASFALVEEPKSQATAALPAPPPEPPSTAAPPPAPPPSFGYPERRDPPLAYAAPASQRWQAPVQADRADRDREIGDAWMLSVEGVTHAPVDVGFMAGVEFPFGLRTFAGYGWVPSAYLDLIVDAATASSEEPGTQTVISNAFDSGTAWRIQAGIRPFRKLGLYLDAGYSQVHLDGSLAASDLAGIAGVPAGAIGNDTYAIDSTIHMWLVELGYQAVLADHIVLGVAAGLMGTIDSSTDATPGVDRAGTQERAVRAAATEIVDQQIESYGFVPTLTLRLGVDLI